MIGTKLFWSARLLARPRLGARAAPLAAACAGSIAALLIFSVVVVVAAAGPDYVIPHLAPPSLSPAVQLSESRIEIEDPYLWTLLLGWFASWPSVLGRRRDRVLVHGPAGEGEVRR